jgi:hypothetical protein
MHKWAKQIMECVKAKVEAIGLDSFEGQNLDDLKDFTEIAKNIVCFDKDYRIVEAMEKSEDNEDIMRMLEQYEDYPDRRYYDHYRYADGRFAPKGRGTRRGYDEPPYYHTDPEWDRDMDRHDGKMHYTDTGMNRPEMKESNYDRAKRHYTETKDMHKADTPEDKQKKMESLDSYMKEITGDVTKLMHDMTAEEKNLLRNKLSTLVSKI